MGTRQTRTVGVLTAILTAVGLAAALLVQAPTAIARATSSSGPVGLVHSDGRRTTAAAAGPTKASSSSFEGNRKLSPTSGPSQERTIPPVSASEGQESVIGADERVRITPTTPYPASAVTLITFSAGRCSGWMSGPDTVVTAGHCVAQGGSFFPVSSYTVYPGYDGTTAPYGGCMVIDMITTVPFISTEDERYDYGVLKLNCQVGLSTGWFGYFWKTTTFNGAPAKINGYPGDKPLTQWKSGGTIAFSGGLMLYYPDDTTGGMSGSAVYRIRPYGTPLCAGYCVMAIHTQGLHGPYPHGTYNHGVRITEEVYNVLMATQNAFFWA